jgi:hypothetical protein
LTEKIWNRAYSDVLLWLLEEEEVEEVAVEVGSVVDMSIQSGWFRDILTTATSLKFKTSAVWASKSWEILMRVIRSQATAYRSQVEKSRQLL